MTVDREAMLTQETAETFGIAARIRQRLHRARVVLIPDEKRDTGAVAATEDLALRRGLGRSSKPDECRQANGSPKELLECRHLPAPTDHESSLASRPGLGHFRFFPVFAGLQRWS